MLCKLVDTNRSASKRAFIKAARTKEADSMPEDLHINYATNQILEAEGSSRILELSTNIISEHLRIALFFTITCQDFGNIDGTRK